MSTKRELDEYQQELLAKGTNPIIAALMVKERREGSVLPLSPRQRNKGETPPKPRPRHNYDTPLFSDL